MVRRSLELRLPAGENLAGASGEGIGRRPDAFAIAFGRFCRGYARPQSEGLGSPGHADPREGRAERRHVGSGSLPNT